MVIYIFASLSTLMHVSKTCNLTVILALIPCSHLKKSCYEFCIFTKKLISTMKILVITMGSPAHPGTGQILQNLRQSLMSFSHGTTEAFYGFEIIL